jgi:electron transport complex protein RnfE
MVTQAYMPALYESLGLYIPLIVVNCIILGRAEAFASKNGPVASIFDGIGMGLGFTFALVIIGFLREFIGNGAAFGIQILPESYPGIGIFTNAPGAFMVMAFVVAVMNKMNIQTRANEVVEDCDGCCANCSKCKSKE